MRTDIKIHDRDSTQNTLSTEEGNINNAGERTDKYRLVKDTLEIEICNHQRSEALEEVIVQGTNCFGDDA